MKVLLTGAAGQVGSEVARLRDEGFDVRAFDREGLDIADADAVARRLDEVAPDLLVNCASTFDHDNITNLEPRTYDRNFAVNLTAPVNLIRALALRGRPGSAVNFLDFKVWRPSPSFLSYTLAKAALQTATAVLARALAPNLRINAVAPGVVLPSGGQSTDEYGAVVRSTLLGREIPLDDIARTVLYLAEAESVTGQTLYVDAGFRFQDYEGVEEAMIRE